MINIEGMERRISFMTKTIELHLTSDPPLLSVMRAAVSKVCELADFEHMETSKIILAIDEACSNIIKHAYKGKSGQSIIITCKIKPTRLEFILEDEGEPADIEKIKSRPLHEIRPGGLGVYLITSVMDKVKYSFGVDRGNRLYMSKQRPKDKTT
ncbi:MAG: ATP-binding protein [Calditrichaeota bacterium]|nr:MAG: ATP-binding protein [Calditrichota bacterium]